MGVMASQITSLAVVYWIVYSGADHKKTSKLRVTGLCAGNSPVTGEFPAQMASNAENIFTWWRHHEWQLVCKYNFFVRLNFVSEIVHYFCQMLPYPPFL